MGIVGSMDIPQGLKENTLWDPAVRVGKIIKMSISGKSIIVTTDNPIVSISTVMRIKKMKFCGESANVTIKIQYEMHHQIVRGS